MTVAPRLSADGEAGARQGAGLIALLAWFSPAFPTGAFAYSHGLEAAAASRRVADESGLACWIAQVLERGAGWTDSVLFAQAYRCALIGDVEGLAEVAELALALAPSRERLDETTGQGGAFAEGLQAGWLQAVAPLPSNTALPIVAGAAAARINAPLDAALTAHLNGFATNLIAAGIRLSLCGQFGGARILAGLAPRIIGLAERAQGSTLNDLGGCAFAAEIDSMTHECLDGRLFIS